MDLSKLKQFQEDLQNGKMFGIRHLEIFLLFTGLVLIFAMRVNMSVAIVAMTDTSTNLNDAPTFPEWSKQIQDMILSSFFWGYVLMQIPTSLIAQRFGEKILFAIAISVNSLASLVLPIAAVKGGWQAVCACRVLQGLSQAAVYPSIQGQLAKWVPITERSRLGTYVNSGAPLGTVIELGMAGIIGGTFGWPVIFYSVGVVGLIWTVFWLYLSADSPAQHRWISDEERCYIEQSTGHTQNTGAAPWKSILTSIPFWAMLAAHCGQNWGFYTLVTEMPTYMKSVLGIELKANGLLSALPYLVLFLVSLAISNISDYTINNNIFRQSTARKIYNSIGHWGPAIGLIALSYAPAGDVITSVALLTLTIGINGGNYSGYAINHIDLSPNYAATLMGLTNMVANIMSMMAPLTVGLIIEDETQASEWRTVFFISAAVYFILNLCFVLFGSAEIQPWNRIEESESNRKLSKSSDIEKATKTATAL